MSLNDAEALSQLSITSVIAPLKVAPAIVALLKQRRIRYSALKSARFSTYDEDGKKTLSPIVVWIATHPTNTSAENARDASPDIIRILEEHVVRCAVLEWYEGSVEKLSGQALMRVADKTNPTYRAGNAHCYVGEGRLGCPENGDRNGDPSARLLDVSNKHVLCSDTTVDYQFIGADASRLYVQVCGMRRFQRLVAETRALGTENVAEAVRLTAEISRLRAKSKSDDPELADEDEEALETNKNELKQVKKDNVKPQAFFKEVNTSRTLYRATSWTSDLANPDCYDENGDPVYIVGKDGGSTDFTVGRYAGLEANIWDEFGKESLEVAVYNYSKTSANFSAKDDSGSLIFTGDGRILAILHSGGNAAM